MKQILERALSQTAQLWPDLIQAYQWIHAAAKILDNEEELSAQQVRSRYVGLMGAMSRWKHKTGELSEYIEHFRKITASYFSGLFHCYWLDGLPRTNNNLEQMFASFRHHQRRSTGLKKALSSTVISGSSKIVAAIATKLKTFSALDLAAIDKHKWQQKRQEIEKLRKSRLQQRHFRKDPDNYLTKLETELLQAILPP